MSWEACPNFSRMLLVARWVLQHCSSETQSSQVSFALHERFTIERQHASFSPSCPAAGLRAGVATGSPSGEASPLCLLCCRRWVCSLQCSPFLIPILLLESLLLVGGKGSFHCPCLSAYLCLSVLCLSKRELCRCITQEWQL